MGLKARLSLIFSVNFASNFLFFFNRAAQSNHAEVISYLLRQVRLTILSKCYLNSLQEPRSFVYQPPKLIVPVSFYPLKSKTHLVKGPY